MATIKFLDTGLEVTCNDGDAVLDVNEEHDGPIQFGCQSGICGVCCSTVVEGAENVSTMTDDEKSTLDTVGGKDNQRLMCQVTISGDVQIRQVD